MRELRAHSRVCDRAREYSSRALDGELSDFERALLDGHLERCAACRAYSEELAAIVGRLRTVPLEALPQPISLPRRRRSRVRVLQVAAAAAAAAVAGTAGLVGAYQENRPTAPRPNASFAALLRSDELHSQDVQVLHQIKTQANMPERSFVLAHGRGQKPA